MDNQTIGARIRSVRKKNALTQARFAERLGIYRPYLSKLENDRAKASKTVIRLMSILYNENENWIKNGK